MVTKVNIRQDIEQRFNKLIVDESKAIALEQKGGDAAKKNTATEDNSAGRELLRVEKIARRDKELNELSQQNYINGISELVHDAITEQIESQLKDMGDVYSRILGIDHSLPELLDFLSVRAATISRIEPIATEIAWLYDDLLKLVNLPKYRRTDSRGKPIVVDTLRMALSFVGIENLRFVIPALSFKRWIPQITDPYPEIKSRLWEEALATAVACKKIASLSGVDEGLAFTAGMLKNMGKIVLVRQYFKLFDKTLRDAMDEAHDDKKPEELSALTHVSPSTTYLINLMDKQHAIIGSQLASRMNCKRVILDNALMEVAQDIPLKDMSKLGAVLAQGTAYAKYRMLKANKRIDMEEAKEYLLKFNFPQGALALLKTTDLKSLNIQFDEI